MEIFRFFVGRRTGPLTRKSFVLARSMSSLQTFSSAVTFFEVRVMRILWIFGWSPCDVFLASWKDILMVVVSVGAGRRFLVVNVARLDHDYVICVSVKLIVLQLLCISATSVCLTR